MSLDLARPRARTIVLAPPGTAVRLLRWPADAPERDALAARATPRLLVVPAHHPAPPVVDELEDWIREPVERSELAARCATLDERAARRAEQPLVDEAGLVWFRDRWTSVPPMQIPLVRLLVERFEIVTSNRELHAAYAQGGASPHPEAVKAAVARLRGRLAPIGLVLKTVRGTGYVLDPADPPS
ncbi:MAG TPA: helix-turn-helix domain-containing protein [Acidimicrobiia bacterium]|nr:helix-turn-helix domain-containing protein [Acidimicrobiia bacterium]